MAFISRRFARLLKVLIISSIACVLFFNILNKVSNTKTPSLVEYKSYIQTYMGTSQDDTSSLGNTDTDNEKEMNNKIPENLLNEDEIIIQKTEDSSNAKDSSTKDVKKIVPNEHELKKLYNQVFMNILEYSPKGATKRKYKENCALTDNIGSRPDYYPSFPKLSYQNLINCLELSDDDMENLKSSHKAFTDSLDVSLAKDSYKGNGIVMVGGGRFSMMSFLIIKNMRKSGSDLPVEVFLPPNEEPEPDFCNELLPKYNAKCIFIDRILDDEIMEKFDFKGYQFKSLAIVASSFENLLLLDADNFPTKSVDHIFTSEPYISTGLVLWPDFWRRTTQPLYYNITGIPFDLNVRVRNSFDDLTPPQVYTEDTSDLSNVPFHDLKGTIPDVSTESGQLLISKSKHLASVLLALYYNVNGPSWYYPIFSQNAAGEGDKETFIAAAHFYGLPYYQVKSTTDVEGYFDDDGFHGVAMLQYDCSQDYEMYAAAKKDVEAKYGKRSKKDDIEIKFDEDYILDSFQKKYFDDKSKKDVMFAHSNLPKFDPLYLWKNNALVDKEGNHFRSFTALRKINYFDIELANFRVFDSFFCSGTEITYFPYINKALAKETDGWKKMCAYIDDRLNFLEKTHDKAIEKQDEN